MDYYLLLNNDGINGVSNLPIGENVEITKDQYDAYVAEPARYIWQNGKLTDIYGTQEYISLKNAEIRQQRIQHYTAEVDHLTAEYNRKALTGAFDDGEQEQLKALIEAAAQKVKDDLPYLTESEGAL